MSQEWVEEGSTYNVTFSVCNEGTASAGDSVAGIYIDGTWQQDQATVAARPAYGRPKATGHPEHQEMEQTIGRPPQEDRARC